MSEEYYSSEESDKFWSVDMPPIAAMRVNTWNDTCILGIVSPMTDRFTFSTFANVTDAISHALSQSNYDPFETWVKMPNVPVFHLEPIGPCPE